MSSGKKLLLCAVLFFSLFFLAEKAAAVPPEKSSHSNSNTGTNLNTLTSTGTITFTINYNASGDIKWYKDNVLVETDANTANGSLITAWTGGDYGKVKQMKVNSTNGDGSSADTVWNVEVQRTGTATISLHEKYVDPTVDFMSTMWVADDGWSNLPSLYLHFKDASLLEYVSERTYILKMPIYVNGGAFYISSDTAKTVKMRGLPVVSDPDVGDYVTKIFVANGGTMKIDKVNFYGWNLTADAELDNGACLRSPAIVSTESNDMDITNCNFRHIMVYYEEDMSANDLVDNNSFYMGDPYNLNLASGDNETSSDGQIFSNNYFYTDDGYTVQGNNHFRNMESPHTVFLNNKFIMKDPPLITAADNTLIGNHASIIGNEWVFSKYNLVDFPTGTFSKFNNLHDPGGYHNGFNMMTNDGYSINDYGHDGFGNYAVFYTQVGDAHGLPYAYPDTLYIFNSASKDSSGIMMMGLYNGYVYNHTADDSGTNIKLGEDHIIFRKCNFMGTGSAITAADLDCDGPDYYYDPVRNIYMIDSVFSHQSGIDYIIDSDPAFVPIGNPTFWNINTIKRSGGSVQRPVADIYFANGEIRHYAYLDVRVQGSDGAAVPGATVTVSTLTSAAYPAIDLLLPPPPPDLTSHPAVNLPMPDVSTFTFVQTDANGHTPLPNYGWSADPEGTPILLYALQKRAGTTSNYSYRITAAYNSQTVYKDVTPDDTWLREDPCQAPKTVVLTFDKPAGKYALNVNGGTGTGLYSQGASVNIAAGIAPSGRVFEKWIGNTAGIANVNSPSTSITVQAADASITAYYKDITHHLTVAGGTGSGDYPAGKIVIVDAAPASGPRTFYKWTGTGASSVVNPAIYSSTLIMPDQDITVTATYRDPVSYTCRLTVADGQGTDFYAPGDNVTVSVSSSPFTDMSFDHWEGDTANLADAGSPATTLTAMPNSYLIIYPVYRDSGLPSNDARLSNLTVSAGTLSPVFTSGTTGYSISVATSLASITVTPTASKGASAVIRVNGTVVNSGSATGPITLSNSGSTTITIIVTAPDTFTTRTYTVTVTKINATAATAYTLTAPSPASGMVDAASGNFTVTPNGKYTGTITITPSGGGLSAPVTLNFSNSSTAKTFTITPTAAGRVTLTPANNGGLTDPAAVTYTAYVPGTLRNSSWNYPNPVNFTKTDKTTIAYTVEEECSVYICLYTLSGDLMKVLVNNKTQAPGKYYMDWYGDNDGGAKVASGVYLYVAKIGNDVIRKKIVLLR